MLNTFKKVYFDFENKANKKIIIFSLPLSNYYQQINNLKINFPNYQIIQEKEWGNKVVIFRLNDVKNKPIITFNFQAKAFSQKIPESFSLDDYKNKKLKIINNRFINGNDQQIKKLTSKIISKEKNIKKIIKKIYDFTLDYLTYGKSIDGLYSYKQAMNNRITDCGGFSTFLASLIQSLNIPTRLVVGFLIKENFFLKILKTFYVPRSTFHNLLMHAWLEVLLPDGSWFPLDPSIEWKRNHGLSKRKGGFGFVPNDRLVVSFGCDFKIKINGKIYQTDLFQNPIFI